MRQTKTMSVVESVTNVVAGFLLSLVVMYISYPLLGITTSISQDVAVLTIFTTVSFIRGYVVRRVFNYLGPK